MRFALLSGSVISLAAAACGATAWSLIEAGRQAATMGNVYVLPPFASVFLPALALITPFVLATIVCADRFGAARMTTILLGVSAAAATTYGVFGSKLHEGAPPYVVGAVFKASSIILLGVLALSAQSRLLAVALAFGALGDALLALSRETFIAGALAFLIGHLFYIALFLRAGIDVRAALAQPMRVLGMAAMVAAAIASSLLLTPPTSPLAAPLSVYTGILTLMVLTSFTLPAARWLAMAGAVLFFVSDGFVALNMFHPNPDAAAAFWLSFAGWMIYWAGQAALCVGALGLHRANPAAPVLPREGKVARAQARDGGAGAAF